MPIRLINTALLLCCLLFAYSTGQSQYLKITHLGLGHGDCTFIIAQEKDGGPVYTAMIDILGTGDEAFNTVRYEFQTDTVLTKSGHRTIDYLIIPPPHTDHFQGVNAFIKTLNAYNKTAPGHQKIKLDSYNGFDATFCHNDIALLQDIQLLVSHPSDSKDYPKEIPLTIGYRTRHDKNRKLINGHHFIPFVTTNKSKNLTACDVDHRWSRFYKEKR